MMGVREAKVEKYLNTRVKSIGGLTRKWVSPGCDGVPDRVVILGGFVYFVEVKTDDGKLSTNQSREHQRLRDVGDGVHTVYGNGGGDLFIDSIR